MQRKSTRRKGGGRTIDDVARHAGVSPMTVSRVINGERNVREATRLRVTEAIRELGYAPNQAARSLASAQTLKIGLLYSNPSAAYLSEFLLGGLDQCSRAGAQLVVEKCEPEVGETVAIERMLAAGVDGVLLPPPLCDSAFVVDRLEAAGLPAVAVASGQPMPSVSAIRIDDQAAAEAMTPEDRRRMVEGMVEGLETRLATQGGTPDEWARLIGALVVIGRQDHARDILAEARARFAATPEALTVIAEAAGKAGLE